MGWGADQTFRREMGHCHGVILKGGVSIGERGVAQIGRLGKKADVCEAQSSHQLPCRFHALVGKGKAEGRVDTEQSGQKQASSRCEHQKNGGLSHDGVQSNRLITEGVTS